MKKIVIFFLLFPSVAFAAPSISGISGTISHGSSVTISGSAFGTKATGAPYRWDPIEGVSEYDGMADDETITATTNGYWDLNNGYRYNTTGTYQRGVSTANMDIPQTPDTCSNGSYMKIGTMLPDNNEYYASFWIWYSISFTTQNSKVVRWWEDHTGNSDADLTIQQSWTENGPWYVGKFDNNDASTCISSGTLNSPWTRPVAGQWERVEIYWKAESTFPTSNDGILWVSQHSNSDIHAYSVDPANFNCAGSSPNLRWFTFGVDMNCSVYAPYRVEMDDIYIDKTRARIEVCDSSTWAARTHCEVQIPSAWSDTSITATLNQGSFGSLGSSYLYAIDSSGNVNSSGYLLSGGGPPPAAPALYISVTQEL